MRRQRATKIAIDRAARTGALFVVYEIAGVANSFNTMPFLQFVHRFNEKMFPRALVTPQGDVKPIPLPS